MYGTDSFNLMFFNFWFGVTFPNYYTNNFEIYVKESNKETKNKYPNIKKVELVERHLFAGQGL